MAQSRAALSELLFARDAAAGYAGVAEACTAVSAGGGVGEDCALCLPNKSRMGLTVDII